MFHDISFVLLLSNQIGSFRWSIGKFYLETNKRNPTNSPGNGWFFPFFEYIFLQRVSRCPNMHFETLRTFLSLRLLHSFLSQQWVKVGGFAGTSWWLNPSPTGIPRSQWPLEKDRITTGKFTVHRNCQPLTCLLITVNCTGYGLKTISGRIFFKISQALFCWCVRNFDEYMFQMEDESTLTPGSKPLVPLWGSPNDFC